MLASLLIANRGEIARRIARTAQRLGIATVAVYFGCRSRRAVHVREAIAPSRSAATRAADSYLRIDAIVAAALATGADAVHPGYGFLSENADFAQAVRGAGLVWVGPPPAAIRAMGDKSAASQRMQQAGVPCCPATTAVRRTRRRFAARPRASAIR